MTDTSLRPVETTLWFHDSQYYRMRICPRKHRKKENQNKTKTMVAVSKWQRAYLASKNHQTNSIIWKFGLKGKQPVLGHSGYFCSISKLQESSLWVGTGEILWQAPRIWAAREGSEVMFVGIRWCTLLSVPDLKVWLKPQRDFELRGWWVVAGHTLGTCGQSQVLQYTDLRVCF